MFNRQHNVILTKSYTESTSIHKIPIILEPYRTKGSLEEFHAVFLLLFPKLKDFHPLKVGITSFYSCKSSVETTMFLDISYGVYITIFQCVHFQICLNGSEAVDLSASFCPLPQWIITIPPSKGNFTL